jgi:hypothetical protein
MCLEHCEWGKEDGVGAKSHRMFTYVVLQERNGIWSLSLRIDRI